MRGLVVYLKCHLILKSQLTNVRAAGVPVRFFTYLVTELEFRLTLNEWVLGLPV